LLIFDAWRMIPVTNKILWFDYKSIDIFFPIILYNVLFNFKISRYYTFIAQQFTKQYITIAYKSQYLLPKYVFYQHRNCFRVRRKWLKDKNEKLSIQTSCLIGKTFKEPLRLLIQSNYLTSYSFEPLCWWAFDISSILPTRSVVETPWVLWHSL